MAALIVISLALGLLAAGTLWSRSAGRRVGPYLLEDKLGEGGGGEVYRARRGRCGEPYAIKLLPKAGSREDRARFERELRVTARLRHPNTVKVHGSGHTRDGRAYYVMELVDGETLRELVEREGPQHEERVVDILLQLCGALREAHAAGLIHREIKPDNVVLSRGGVAKLLDFGLVKEVGSVETTMTREQVVGTPLFMSPEAISAPSTVGEHSDVYGLGAVAFYLLTGAPVFVGDSVIEVLSQHLYSAPERPSRIAGRAIAGDLERVVLDCLAKNPLERPRSAAELAHRLEAALLDRELLAAA